MLGPQPRFVPHSDCFDLNISFPTGNFPFVDGRVLYKWKAVAHLIVPVLSAGSCFLVWILLHICVQLVRRKLQGRRIAYTSSLTDLLAGWHIAWASMGSGEYRVRFCASACRDNIEEDSLVMTIMHALIYCYSSYTRTVQHISTHNLRHHSIPFRPLQ